jgi:hypothetical protein
VTHTTMTTIPHNWMPSCSAPPWANKIRRSIKYNINNNKDNINKDNINKDNNTKS